MGDALIFLSCVEYMKGQKSSFYFISENTSDFGSKDPKELAEFLVEVSKGIKLFYHINVAEALNQIQENVLSKEVVKLVEKRRREAQQDISVHGFFGCIRCNMILNDREHGRWINAYGGPQWHYECPRCGVRCNTGEYLDYY